MYNLKSKRRIVGLTGRNAAGKGEVAKILREWGYAYHSLSDILRNVASERGLTPSREVLINLGRELRQSEGTGTLATRTISLLTNGLYIVDSVRNPGEIEALRKAGDFFLISVDAPSSLRFNRAGIRGRMENANTLEEFESIERRESGTEPAAQQLDVCIGQADENIFNDKTLEILKKRVVDVLQRRGFPCKSN